MRSVRLHCHPSTPCDAVGGLAVHVAFAPPADVALSFELAGDIGRLRIPAPRMPARRDGLWRHTCCEMLVRARGESYCELNFSPSGEWAAYSFTGYRTGMTRLDLSQPPAVRVRTSPSVLRLDARVSLPGASVLGEPAPLRLALCAVVEEMDGRISYWAATHAGEQPDFHRRESFVIDLERHAASASILRDARERT